MTAVLVAVVVVLATGCASSIYQAPFINRDSQDAIEGEYLVVLKGHLTEEKVAAHIDHVRTQALLEYRYAKKQESDIYGAVEEDDVDAYPKRMQPDVIMTTFSVGDIKGYGARLSDRLRDNLRRMKEVKYIEQNIIGRAESCKIRRNAEWGLVRTTVQTILGKGKKYDYKWDSDGAGKGVVIYVIDS
eukprot:Em0008g163a